MRFRKKLARCLAIFMIIALLGQQTGVLTWAESLDAAVSQEEIGTEVVEPTPEPTVEPAEAPEEVVEPTPEPTVEPAEVPEEVVEPTPEPTVEPAEALEEVVEPTPEPTVEPTEAPEEVVEPTPEPTVEPTETPAIPEEEVEIVLDTNIVQEVFQITMEDGIIQPVIKYVVTVQNLTEGHNAENVEVGAILASALTYKKEAAETAGLKYFDTIEDAIAQDVFTDGEITSEIMSEYAGCDVVTWADQTINVNEIKTFEFYALPDGSEFDEEKLGNVWITNKGIVDDVTRIKWINSELLIVEETLEEIVVEEVIEDIAPAQTEFIFEDDKMIVTAVLSEYAVLPEGAVFVVNKQEPTEEEMALIESAMGEEQVLQGYAVYDMHFEVDGVEVEPENGEVSVSVIFKETLQLEAADT